MYRFVLSGFLILTSIVNNDVKALTVDEFRAICEISKQECTKHPILQAYVGGGLDLIATLDERTNYLDTPYCKSTKELFDVAKVINYILNTEQIKRTDNAMLSLVHYFEKNGGCRQ